MNGDGEPHLSRHDGPRWWHGAVLPAAHARVSRGGDRAGIRGEARPGLVAGAGRAGQGASGHLSAARSPVPDPALGAAAADGGLRSRCDHGLARTDRAAHPRMGAGQAGAAWRFSLSHPAFRASGYGRRQYARYRGAHKGPGLAGAGGGDLEFSAAAQDGRASPGRDPRQAEAQGGARCRRGAVRLDQGLRHVDPRLGRCARCRVVADRGRAEGGGIAPIGRGLGRGRAGRLCRLADRYHPRPSGL